MSGLIGLKKAHWGICLCKIHFKTHLVQNLRHGIQSKFDYLRDRIVEDLDWFWRAGQYIWYILSLWWETIRHLRIWILFYCDENVYYKQDAVRVLPQVVNCLSLSVWRHWRCTTGLPTVGRRWREERTLVRTWSFVSVHVSAKHHIFMSLFWAWWHAIGFKIVHSSSRCVHHNGTIIKAAKKWRNLNFSGE